MQSDVIFWGKIAPVLEQFKKLMPPLTFFFPDISNFAINKFEVKLSLWLIDWLIKEQQWTANSNSLKIAQNTTSEHLWHNVHFVMQLPLRNTTFIYAWFSYTCNHALRRHTPRDFQFFSFLGVYSLPSGMQKETIPHHRAPDWCFSLHLFDPYKSKTTHFHNFYKRFPEFIEGRIVDVKM